MDHWLPVGVDLLPQIGDIQVDNAGAACEVVVPNPIQDLGTAQCSSGIAHQESKQFELGRGERDRRTVAGYLPAGPVERKVSDPECLIGGPFQMAGAAQQPAQPGDQLLEAERLCHVVVGARGQTGDPVHHGIARGEEQRGCVDVGFSDPSQDFQPVHIGKHDVEDQHIGADLVELGYGLLPVVGDFDIPAFVVQRHLDQIGQRWFVIDQQHPDR